MRQIDSRHFQIFRKDEYWRIPCAKVSSRDYSSIYARTPENVKLAIHYSRNKFFGEKIRFGETNRRTMNSILHTIRLFVIRFRRKLFYCKSTNISFEFCQNCQKTAFTGERATKHLWQKIDSPKWRITVYTIRVLPTFFISLVFCHYSQIVYSGLYEYSVFAYYRIFSKIQHM